MKSRIFSTLEELRSAVRVHEATQCWEFLRENGESLGPKTVPSLGNPPKQVAVIAVELSGRSIPRGWLLRRMRSCLRFCCNPNHLRVVHDKRGERKGAPSNNPHGNPAALVPNAGRAPGTARSTRGKPSSNPYGRAGKPLHVEAHDVEQPREQDWESLRKDGYAQRAKKVRTR